MPMPSRFWRLPLLAVVVAVGALLAGCGSSSDSSSSGDASFTGDALSNVDIASTRAVQSKIDSGNVTELEEVWSAAVKGTGVYGSYASTPVIANGVVYSQDLESNVEAIDLASGDVLWTKKWES